MKNDNISQMSKEATEKYQKLLSELSNVFDVDLDQADPIEKMRIEYIKDALIGSLVRIKTAQNNNSVSIDHSYVLEFALEENGTYSVIGITHCHSENIIVPNIYMGKPVQNIADYAFSDCREIKKVIIEDGIISIGKESFSGCRQLEQIILPNSLISIGNGAFSCCEKMDSIDVPNSVQIIGDHAFHRCHALKNVVLSNSLVKINRNMFYNCDSLKAITIPSNVQVIESWAFANCESMEEVFIPESVIVIERYNFAESFRLKYVKFETPVGWYTTSDSIGSRRLKDALDVRSPAAAAKVLRSYSGSYAFVHAK